MLLQAGEPTDLTVFYRDREERLAALTAAQQEAMEELQKKIQLKVGTAWYFNLKIESLNGAHYKILWNKSWINLYL